MLALMEQGKEDSPISSDDDRSERTGDSGIDESDKPGKKEAQVYYCSQLCGACDIFSCISFCSLWSS